MRPSLLKQAGNGLFADQSFLKGQIITEYGGEIIDRKTALQRSACGRGSHIRTLIMGMYAIDGFKHPSAGLPGGSFANDARDVQKQNAKYVIKSSAQNPMPRVFLQATRDIQRGEEVYVSYGKSYWRVYDQSTTE